MTRALSDVLHILCFVLISSSCVPVFSEEVVREMDVVVTVKVTPANLPQDYSDSIRSTLFSDMRSSFPRIISLSTPAMMAGPEKDGAAKFRLFLDYASVVTCGTQLTMKAEKADNAGGNFTKRSWYLAFDQKATFTARLAKWSGTRYEDLMKFGGPVPKKETRDPGPLLVFQRSTPTKSADKDPDVCPLSLEAARGDALQTAMPSSLRAILFSKLVPISLLKATPTKMDGVKPAEMAVELKIDNKSPWPLKSVAFNFVQGGVEFSVGSQDIALTTPIAPGQATAVKAIARPQSGGLQPGTQSAEFVVPTP